MRVETYRNLHNKSLSVRRVGGRVFTRPQITFIRSPKFVVQPAGRAKVLAEKKKNVHAFVRGEFVAPERGARGWKDWSKANYNPYKADTFIDVATGQPVTEATYAVVTTEGVFYK